MNLDNLGKEIFTEAVKGVVACAPTTSPLDGADPRGRVDVLVSRIAERVVVGSGGIAALFYPQLKPAVDVLIVSAVSAVRPKPVTAKNTKRRRTRR
jgi:hypothetical protein